MRQLGIALGMAQRATASGARLFELLDRAPRLVTPARRAAAAAGARPGRARRRHLRLRAGARGPRCATSTSSSRPGTTVALVGGDRLGQDDARAAPRRGSTTSTAGAVRIDGADVREVDLASLRGADRGRHRRPVPVQRHRPRQHRLRPPGRHPRGGRARRRARPGGRLRRRAARRLRHAHRRARPHALGRPAPAHRDRPRAARRPAHPRPRRRDLLRRRLDGAGDQGGAARGDGRPHDVRDRPPPLDDRARRRDRRARGRARRRARHHDELLGPLAALRGDRREGPARPGLPHPQIRAKAVARACAATRRDDLVRRWRATGGRGRKLRGLAALLRPYRARVRSCVALVRGHRRRARPAAAGQARDRRGHRPRRPRRARPDRRWPSSPPRSSTGAPPTRRPTSSAGSASGSCRTCASSSSPTSRRCPWASSRAARRAWSSPA